MGKWARPSWNGLNFHISLRPPTKKQEQTIGALLRDRGRCYSSRERLARKKNKSRHKHRQQRSIPSPNSKKHNLPVEGLAYEPAALHGLHERQDLEVGHLLDLIVRRLEEVLLRHQHSLLEEVRVNRQAVLLLDELQ